MDRIAQLKEQLKAALVAARDLAAKAEEESRDFTDEERSTIAAKMAEAQDVKKRMELAKADSEVMTTIAELGDGIGLNEKASKPRLTDGGLIVRDGKASVGELWAKSAEYQGLLASAPNGVFQEKQRIQSMPLGFKSLVTGGNDNSAGAWVVNDRVADTVGLDAFQRPLRLRDVVSPGTTTSDTVEYVRLTGTTNNAMPVPEATSSAMPAAPGGAGALVLPAGGGYKPESAFATQKITTPVKTIAHWIPVTKRALSDAAQVKTLIDNFLAYGLEEELEDQMIAGDGTGENFEGLGHVSGVQQQAYDTNHLTTLRKARTKVRIVGRSLPNAYLVNPTDLEYIDLLQDNEARYYFGGPGQLGTAAALWGLPVIETEAVPAGVAYCGDWRKCILWDREQASITATDSHADFFVRNLVAILAEMRAAFGCIQPNAFVAVDLTP